MSKISPGYRADIDGIRGIAVFCVVMFHAGLSGFGGGFVGVDIFFVISGYLICAIIAREIETESFSFAQFYARRARRILPALFVVLLASFIVATAILTSAEMVDFARSAVANIGAASNIYFWKSANYFSTSAELKPLMMTWSLSVEEQFYLFFPPVLLLVRRMKWDIGITLAVLSLVSFAASAWETPRHPTTAFFLLHTRAWELGIGALLAHVDNRAAVRRYVLPARVRESFGAAGLLALVWSIACFDHATSFPGIAASVPVLGTAMLIAARGSMVNRHVLANKALVFVGLVSYSWYLWHWPLMSFSRVVADKPINLTTALTLAAVSFFIAIVSWRFVEQPFRSGRVAVHKTLWRYGAATTCMLGIAGVLIYGHGWKERLPDDFNAIERSGAVQVDPCLIGYGQSIPSAASFCNVSLPADRVALIGDSHAAALAPALRTLAHDHALGFVQLTKVSCPMLIGVTRRILNYPEHAHECAAFNDSVLKRLYTDADIKVVFVAGYWSAPFAEEADGQRFVAADHSGAVVTTVQSRYYLRDGLAATVKDLLAAGKTVVLLEDAPILKFDPVRAVATETIPMRKRLAALLNLPQEGDGHSVSDSLLANKDDLARQYINAVAKDYPLVTVIDPATTLCPSGRCHYRGNGNLYYIDSQHLSAAGATRTLDRRDVDRLLDDSHMPATRTSTEQAF